MKIITKFKNFSVIAACALALVGCDDNDNPIQAVQNTVNETSQLAQMDGDWQSPCSHSDMLNSASREKWHFDSQKREFERNDVLYSDAECNSQVAEIKYRGNFDVTRIEGADEIREFNLDYHEMVAKAADEATSNALNAIEFCGQSNWASGQELVLREIDNERCFVSKFPAVYYGIVSVENNNLYMSEMEMDSALRPRDVDRNNVFSKN